MKKAIPTDIQLQVSKIVDCFNKQSLRGKSRFVTRFKGGFLYLDREDFGNLPCEICRLKYTGSLDKWEFAIFKHSSNKYCPDEWMFPGTAHLDGSIEGAMFCGLEAYPV